MEIDKTLELRFKLGFWGRERAPGLHHHHHPPFHVIVFVLSFRLRFIVTLAHDNGNLIVNGVITPSTCFFYFLFFLNKNDEL